MNIVHEPRPPKNQRDYSIYELNELMKAHNTDVTVQELSEKLGRSINSIRKKACSQGIKLRRELVKVRGDL